MAGEALTLVSPLTQVAGTVWALATLEQALAQ